MLLSRLRAALAAAAVDDVNVHLSIIGSLASSPRRPLQLALANQGAIPEIIKVLMWCNTRLPDANTMKAIVLSYGCIHQGFYSTNGSIKIAYHSALVEIITVEFLSKLLSKYLIFRSVLRAVRKAIRQVKKKGLESKASAGALWDGWNEFQMLAEARLIHYGTQTR
ncbi:hypothetical protein PLICRDRAFT_176828 [Plicaturopsis crispa FD-325 SS-3]|nr:hypothetical protein PLICRDRAFT_176828 [Plicaturopsis crispa FD-325 SS-3]